MKKIITLLIIFALLPASAASAGDGIVTVWVGGAGGTIDWENDRILHEIENKAGSEIRLTFIPEGYVDKLATAASALDMPDIIAGYPSIDWATFEAWKEDGLIAPVKDEVAEAAPNWLALYAASAGVRELQMDGDIYLCPLAWGTGTEPNMGLVHVRGDLMERYGFDEIDTFDDYLDYLEAAVADGYIGVTLSGFEELIPSALNVVFGGFGLPYTGWVRDEAGEYTHWSMHTEVGEAIALIHDLVKYEVVDPKAWACDMETARMNFVSGQAASLISAGGSDIARIQNEMNEMGEGAVEVLLPALDFGNGVRGYTREDMFSGVTLLGNTELCDPILAAGVVDFLLSEAGAELCAVGVEDEHFIRSAGEIEWLDARFEDGFPLDALDAGPHPLARGIVSWQPEAWRDFAVLYGRGDSYRMWYERQRENQRMYQIPCYGRNAATPAWSKFQNTAEKLYIQYALEALNADSPDEIEAIWDRYMHAWWTSGGDEATMEMNALLREIYG